MNNLGKLGIITIIYGNGDLEYIVQLENNDVE